MACVIARDRLLAEVSLKGAGFKYDRRSHHATHRLGHHSDSVQSCCYSDPVAPSSPDEMQSQ